MAALAKGVSLSFGVITASVSVFNAIEPKISNVSVCQGGVLKPGETTLTEHGAIRISMKRHCPECGEVPYDKLAKAREVGGGYVILNTEEIATAKADANDYKKLASLTPHPAEQVEAGTVPGEKLYYLTPEKGAEQNYAVLRHLVESHPELTFMALWTPRTSAGRFALRLRGDVLVLQERITADATKPVPVVDADAPEALLAMAGQLLGLDGIVTDFDAEKYADQYELKLQKIIESKSLTPVSSGKPDADAVATDVATDLMAALKAKVDEAKAAQADNVTPIKKKKVAA